MHDPPKRGSSELEPTNISELQLCNVADIEARMRIVWAPQKLCIFSEKLHDLLRAFSPNFNFYCYLSARVFLSARVLISANGSITACMLRSAKIAYNLLLLNSFVHVY